VQINPYLNFDGNCREALEFYAKALGGTIEFMQTHADSPMKDQTPPAWRDKILHARLRVGNQVLMASDAPPQHYSPAGAYYISIGVETPEEAERIWAALSAGAKVDMPLQQTFWAKRFAMFKDRFGTPWMINC
jgi:PhnB protein